MKIRLGWAIVFAVILYSSGFPQLVFADTSADNAIGTPFVYLDKWGGPVGTVVTVRCSGFYPAKLISFKYSYPSNSQLMIFKISDTNGTCEIEFIIPASPEGRNYITASNEVGQSVITEFTVIPAVTIEPVTVSVGDEVNVRGTGYPSIDKVKLYINGVAISDVIAEANGSFMAIFAVPSLKSGVNLVEIKNQLGDIRWLELRVTSKLLINKTTGEVGARLTLSGTGFEADAPVQIIFDSAKILTIDTDDLGKFSNGITVPVTNAGSHFISVTDGVNTQQLLFIVENVPPPVPQLLSPKRKGGVTQPITFDWGSVFDPSEPVKYEIQIAHDVNFRDPVIIRENLTESEYTLTAGEELLPNRRWNYYYWRIRATDSAGNISVWSIVSTFYVPPQLPLPDWSKYLLIVLGILIATGYGIILSRIISPPQKKTGL